MTRPAPIRPIVVFDLDGTLVDTAPDLLDSLNHCLECAGLQRAAPQELRRFVGMGGRVMIERAFASQRHELTTPRLDELQAVFLDHYGGNMPGRSQPFPGVIAALDRLGEAGYLQAVCTNKYEALSTRLIASLDLTERFAAICGADTFSFRKPDPRHLLETIRMAGGDPAHAIMVGDSRTDIDTAKAAGIPVIAVDFGYTDQHVRTFSPSRIISHFDELTTQMTEELLAALAR
ncbi:MAG: phosphoglycolate phosphatase [Aquamicrobium sp.]|uniref:HAD family hydrolase n=1 Tax=Aquamicrobium sp. TaxID=1872579 RepID=UPI00349EA775|nr:phosphoglycolate phosphatase [Aquamicrobium sp.]